MSIHAQRNLPWLKKKALNKVCGQCWYLLLWLWCCHSNIMSMIMKPNPTSPSSCSARVEQTMKRTRNDWWAERGVCEETDWVLFLSPCVVDPSLTQDPERNTHTSQELIPELQVAGVPQIHPDHKTKHRPQLKHGKSFRGRSVQHWHWCHGLTSVPAYQRLLLQHQTAALCSLMAVSPRNADRHHVEVSFLRVSWIIYILKNELLEANTEHWDKSWNNLLISASQLWGFRLSCIMADFIAWGSFTVGHLSLWEVIAKTTYWETNGQIK